MPVTGERLLSAALIDIDGTLTELGSVSWLDFTEQMWVMAGKTMGEAKAARKNHYEIFNTFRLDVEKIKSKKEKIVRIDKLNNDLFDQVWRPSGLDLTRKNVVQISRAVLTFRLRPEGVRFLQFLSILVDQLKIPVFVLTSANSVLAEVVASDFKLSGGKASAQMIFDGDKSESLWTGFTLDPDLNRSKVRNADELKGEGKLSYPSSEILVVGDGPTEHEMVEYYDNNIIVSRDHIDSSLVSAYAENLDQVLLIMYEQLGDEAEKLNLPDDIRALLRTRTQT